jgi:hypothetical protein
MKQEEAFRKKNPQADELSANINRGDERWNTQKLYGFSDHVLAEKLDEAEDFLKKHNIRSHKIMSGVYGRAIEETQLIKKKIEKKSQQAIDDLLFTKEEQKKNKQAQAEMTAIFAKEQAEKEKIQDYNHELRKQMFGPLDGGQEPDKPKTVQPSVRKTANTIAGHVDPGDIKRAHEYSKSIQNQELAASLMDQENMHRVTGTGGGAMRLGPQRNLPHKEEQWYNLRGGGQFAKHIQPIEAWRLQHKLDNWGKYRVAKGPNEMAGPFEYDEKKYGYQTIEGSSDTRDRKRVGGQYGVEQIDKGSDSSSTFMNKQLVYINDNLTKLIRLQQETIRAMKNLRHNPAVDAVMIENGELMRYRFQKRKKKDDEDDSFSTQASMLEKIQFGFFKFFRTKPKLEKDANIFQRLRFSMQKMVQGTGKMVSGLTKMIMFMRYNELATKLILGGVLLLGVLFSKVWNYFVNGGIVQDFGVLFGTIANSMLSGFEKLADLLKIVPKAFGVEVEDTKLGRFNISKLKEDDTLKLGQVFESNSIEQTKRNAEEGLEGLDYIFDVIRQKTDNLSRATTADVQHTPEQLEDARQKTKEFSENNPIISRLIDPVWGLYFE